MMWTIIWIALGIFAFIALSLSIVITPQNNYSFITLLGKYEKTLGAGLGFKIPFLTGIDSRVFLGLQNKAVPLSLKTSDHVNFKLGLNVQYIISSDKQEAFKAVYNIEDLEGTMIQVATNAAIPIANEIDLEEVFNAKEKITEAAMNALNEFFSADYGVTIKSVLSNEPELPREVEDSANGVVTAKRARDAAVFNAETIKTEKVGEAKADGEAVKIRTQMLGESRKEYAEKTADAVAILVKSGVSPQQALSFLSHIGDNDAVVTASRNEANTIIIANGGSDSSGTTDVTALVEALGKNKTES